MSFLLKEVADYLKKVNFEIDRGEGYVHASIVNEHGDEYLLHFRGTSATTEFSDIYVSMQKSNRSMRLDVLAGQRIRSVQELKKLLVNSLHFSRDFEELTKAMQIKL